MSEFTVTIDTSQWDDYRDKLDEKFENMGDLLNQYLMNRVVPALEAEAGSQRNVRTGRYSTTWNATQQDSMSAIVTTQAFYWKYLEFGTSRMSGRPVVEGVLNATEADLAVFIGGALVQG